MKYIMKDLNVNLVTQIIAKSRAKFLMVLTLLLMNINAAQAQNVNDIVSFLNDANLTQLMPNMAKSMQTPWGILKESKPKDGEWAFSQFKNQQLIKITFAQAEGTWLLNDVTISIFAGDDQCEKSYQHLSSTFKSSLGKAKVSSKDSGAGMFWLSKSSPEWGYWISIIETKHPSSGAVECTARATFAFGADEYLSEDSEG